MSNAVIKYHNDFNKIQLPRFTEQEQNLLFGILAKVKDNPDRQIKLLPSEIMQFSTKNYTNKELKEVLTVLKDKFFKADFMILIEDAERELVGKQWVNLFETFTLWFPKADENHTQLLYVELKVNAKFQYIINEVTKNFTRFELAEFTGISGKYTKTLYRLLKQFRSTGYLRMEWTEFVRVMDIPTNYKQIDVDQWILKPALKELTKEHTILGQQRIPFHNLTYTKIKDKSQRGRGGKVVGIEFSFDPQEMPKELEDAIAVEATSIEPTEAKEARQLEKPIVPQQPKPTTQQETKPATKTAKDVKALIAKALNPSKANTFKTQGEIQQDFKKNYEANKALVQETLSIYNGHTLYKNDTKYNKHDYLQINGFYLLNNVSEVGDLAIRIFCTNADKGKKETIDITEKTVEKVLTKTINFIKKYST